jgi:hypothetical protein
MKKNQIVYSSVILVNLGNPNENPYTRNTNNLFWVKVQIS